MQLRNGCEETQCVDLDRVAESDQLERAVSKGQEVHGVDVPRRPNRASTGLDTYRAGQVEAHQISAFLHMLPNDAR